MNNLINNFLTIEETSNDVKWDKFIFNSTNKNYYALSDNLSLEEKHKKFFIFKKKEIIASFSLVYKNKDIIFPTYNLYTPINYKIASNSKSSSINSDQLQINQLIMNYLVNNYEDISIIFDYKTSDIRPFSWYGYPDYKKKFILDVKYTFISNIKNINLKNCFESEIFLNSSETNRREIRNSFKLNYEFREEFSKEIFFKLKKSSYKIHNEIFDEQYYEKIFNIIKNLHDKKLTKMYVGYYKGEPYSMNIFSFIGDKAMFLQSGRSENLGNKNFCGLYVFFNAIIHLSKAGAKTLDFEGINSPKNSFSKIKFGGKIFPYYSLKLNKIK